MASTVWRCEDCYEVWPSSDIPFQDTECDVCGGVMQAWLTPSADLPACRDEDPATPAVLAACYPDPPEYQHPEDDWGRGGEPYERAEAEEIDAYWEATDDGV